MAPVAVSAPTVRLHDGRVTLTCGDAVAEVHPHWLRDRSTETGQIEPTNRQRLFTPLDVPVDIAVVACDVVDHALHVAFSDGHRAVLDLGGIEIALGWREDSEEPPAPEPWAAPLADFPDVDWRDITFDPASEDVDALIGCLRAFFRHGYVVFRNTPAEVGTVARVADRLGYLVGQNFGWVFDVEAKPAPTDLAYTSYALRAHTDEPYRRPVPGIQMLHCIRNEALGGDSTLVDGMAAAMALAAAHPEWHAALVDTEVVFRYDMGVDTVVNRGHILEYDRSGRYRQIRLNTKLDEPIVRPGVDLDAYYLGRRWLTEWTNDPAHQVTFRLEPGDIMFMDNQRALHGRTAFDPTSGHRHLQGCYIEHDGPDTMYRLAVRRRRAKLAG
ncbi:TauD/TfdA family dioxygenase [Ilumatobacter sp.]|uniref:TauD/TfdA family dioxygenase n=1 Tax=Ilumatobacter sp. TaxID=1967498 RepID=UPI003AF78BA7